ncbi:MAG: DUF58 domain-containing protein [Proteobacteria bacterium]|nr:DUF58 domain-containing protein [Pseudomonadota bacterium]
MYESSLKNRVFSTLSRAKNKSSLGIQRIFILPTIAGLVFLSSVIIVFLYGASNQRADLMGISLFLSLLFLLAMIESIVNLRGVNFSVESFVYICADKNNSIAINIQSDHEAHGLQIDFDHRSRWKMFWLDQFGIAATKETAVLRLNLDPLARGIHTLPKLMCRSRFPFGLILSWRVIDLKKMIVVYPYPRGESWAEFMGHSMISQRQLKQDFDSEFLEYKVWNITDGVNRIDWKSSGKRGQYMTRVFEDSNQVEGNERILKLSAARQTDTEQKISQVCKWCFEAFDQQQRFSIDLFGQVSEMGSGDNHLKSVLEILANFKFEKQN